MTEQLELVWARWCARRVLYLWDAPEVVRTWLDTGEEVLRREAGDVALCRGEAAWATVEASAWAAWAASWATVEASWAAETAAGRGVGAKVAAARAEAAQAAREAEHQAQKHARTLITSLATLLPEHGLAALRLDEALEDRWITREVWRVVMEREVEVQVRQDDGTTYHTEIVRVVADWGVVCDWAEAG